MSTTETAVVPTEETAATETEVASQEASAQEEANNTNINNLSLGDQVDNINPEADIDTVVLPHDGIHVLRLKAGKKGVYGPTTDKDGNLLSEAKIGKDGRAFFVADIEAYLVHENPKYDNIRIFRLKDALSPGIYLTSQVNSRNPTSAAADLANKSGYPFQKGATLNQNRDHLEQLLASEITVKGIIQWQGTKETGENDEGGYPIRTIVMRGEKSFDPLVINGEVQMENGQPLRNARFMDQYGNEIVAQAVVTRFLPINS